tara:strand:- start:9726 stop:10808 length:1083 start_codon:yes stop_codon:yes gene_type:complete
MSENKDNENEFERDFSEGAEEENSLNEDNADLPLNDETSDSLEESIIEPDNAISEYTDKTPETEIDPIAEANESLITMNSAPFDKTLEAMSQTLSSIDNKMDIENLQLQKLDQLSEIKEQLDRLETFNMTPASTDSTTEPEDRDSDLKVTSEVEEEMSQNSIGHNQQEISELLEKVATLEGKIQTIEDQSNNANERFIKIENIIERFENLENEIQVVYEDDEEEKPNFFKNLFQKKEKSESYTDNVPEISLSEIKIGVPKDTQNIIEEAESSQQSANNQILINEDDEQSTNNQILINEDDEKNIQEDDKVKKPNSLKYGLGMTLLLATIIIVLFFLDEFEIINLSYSNVMNSISNIRSLF